MEEQLNRFFEAIMHSVRAVDKQYLNTVYNDIEGIKYAFGRNDRRNIDKNKLYKSAERTFCNEFYHQLRIRIDRIREINPAFLHGTLLQSEVPKYQVLEMLQRLGLQGLSANFIPDFLMHTPGTADLHAFVIEVKSNRFLSFNELKDDISKLAEFIIRYDYKRGVFIGINLSLDDISDLIGRCHFNQEVLEASNRIRIVTRDREANEANDCALNEFEI